MHAQSSGLGGCVITDRRAAPSSRSPSMLLTLLFSFAVFVGGHDYGRITLLLGDSVDRFTVQAWCGHHAGNKPKEWGSHSIRYVNKNIAHPPQFCHAPRLHCSLASVHIYGTNSTGPYYGGFINTEEDIYGDTTPRIANGRKQRQWSSLC